MALLIIDATGVSVRAQEQPPAPQQNQVTAEPEQAGPGRQLAHESREAAGQEKDEKDEFAEFKHSPSVSWISRELHISIQSAYWLSFVFNFAVIGIVIAWASRKYLPGMFRDRTAAIQKAMQEAQKASAEARQKLAQIESRLQKLDDEIATIRDSAEKEGEAEAARILAAAQDDARKIIASAEQEISAAAKAARRRLTAYAADLAVGLAQKQIHVDASTDQALVRSFAGQLGSAEAVAENPGKSGD